jgi:hypothetical protein
MYKAGLYTLTLITALTTGSMLAGAQNYSRAVSVPGITGLISHDAVPQGFDPVSASADQLEEYGFPPRPDPNDKELYSKWVQAASFERVAGEFVNTGRYHRPIQHKTPIETNSKDNISALSSGNWSGFAITGGSTILTEVVGTWIVPTVNNQFESINGYMSEWVGIDGDCSCNDLIQDGTAQQYVGGKASYYAWVEFIPESEVEISTSKFPIAPGDVIQAYTWVTENSSHQIVGNFQIVNYNTRKTASASLTIPAGTAYSGQSAEWIVERTDVGGNYQRPMPFYAYSFMGGAYAFRNSSTAIPYLSQANENIGMYQGGTELSSVSALDSTSMWFKWDNYF